MNKTFFKALGIWLLLTDGSAFVLFLRHGWPKPTEWFALLEIFVLTLACALLLRFLLRFTKSPGAASFTGLAVGAGVSILGALAIAEIFGAALGGSIILIGGLIYAIPNGIGGALAGWLQSKAASPSSSG